MGFLAALALSAAVASNAPVPVAHVYQPSSDPISLVGFVGDGWRELERLGVRVVIAKVVQTDGSTVITAKVYGEIKDAFGNEYWQESTASCSAAPSPLVVPYTATEPAQMILFDRFHPPEQKDNDSEEQH